MTDRFMARLSGVLVLLSMGTEIASIALAASHGSADSMNAMNWGVGDEFVFFQAPWMTRWFPLAILAPAFAMLAFPAMYSVLARGGSAAFCGVIASSFGLVLGVLGEMIRLSMAVTLPARYLAASEVARPAVLALGAFL